MSSLSSTCRQQRATASQFEYLLVCGLEATGNNSKFGSKASQVLGHKQLHDACVRRGCAPGNFCKPKPLHAAMSFVNVLTDMDSAKMSLSLEAPKVSPERNARSGLTLRLLVSPCICPSVPGHLALPATDAAGSAHNLKMGATRT